MKHISLVAALILGAACGSIEGSEETSDESPINGHSNFDSSCSGYEATIDAAMDIAYANMTSGEMRSCLKQTMISYTEEYPEWIIRDMLENLTTRVSCASLDPNVLAEAPESPTETITLDYSILLGDLDEIAAIILHEVSHNKGYRHPDAGTTLEYNTTVPQQLRQCSLSISNGGDESTAVGFGKRRDSLAHETILAPSGEVGGNAFEISCSSGHVAKGLWGRAATRVDAVGMECGTPSGGVAIFKTPVGGPGGSTFHTTCNVGEVLVGVSGRAGVENDRVDSICATASSVQAGLYQPRLNNNPAGGTGGYAYSRRCPNGMAVRAIKGKFWDHINRMELECQDISDTTPPDISYLAHAGGSGGQTTYEKCPGRAAIVGLTQRTGSSVDRLGARCKEVVHHCNSAGCFEDVSGSDYQMPAWGGDGGDPSDELCSSGSVVVGLRFTSTNGEVNRIGAECADASLWTANGTATITHKAAHPSGSTSFTRMCAPGELLVGWIIGSHTRVDSVDPICRAF